MRTTAFVLALLGCRATAPEVATAPPPEPVAPVRPDPQRLSRGDYVVALAGCKVCHTPIKDGVPDGTLAFAGGLEVQLPDGGVWRAPNITPDRETGIGAWSDTQIITAIRRGIRPDASRLLPVMPYPYFHRMSDSDAKAVVTYLRSLRPIKHAVGRSEVTSMPPVRLGEPENNVDPVDDARGHGEYIANLMHCGACHTPVTGPHANQTFAGGVVLPVTATQQVTSANITSEIDTGLGQWTEGDILAAVRTGQTPDHREIVGPMRAFMEGWARLDERDAHALAEYIKSVPPVRHEIPEPRTH
jgi:mono/diheme cytochrome c family protein